MIGRQSECGALDHLLRKVRGGHSGVVVVRGEPGVGKTALLGSLAASASGFRVVSATGVESEAELAFAALQQLLAPMLNELDTATTTLQPATGPD